MTGTFFFHFYRLWAVNKHCFNLVLIHLVAIRWRILLTCTQPELNFYFKWVWSFFLIKLWWWLPNHSKASFNWFFIHLFLGLVEGKNRHNGPPIPSLNITSNILNYFAAGISNKPSWSRPINIRNIWIGCKSDND